MSKKPFRGGMEFDGDEPISDDELYDPITATVYRPVHKSVKKPNGDVIPRFASDEILAAAYRGKRANLKTTLTHAVPLGFFRHKKTFRSAGEALCNRKLDVAGHHGSVENVDCPRCMDILMKLGVF